MGFKLEDVLDCGMKTAIYEELKPFQGSADTKYKNLQGHVSFVKFPQNPFS